jgi:hypothetical protein
MKNSKYEFYSDNKSKVIAVSHYAGKVVRGVAKCNPTDDFDIEAGKEIAKARCDAKVATKRAARAKLKKERAYQAYLAASDYADDMNDYCEEAEYAASMVNKELEAILTKYQAL